MLLTKIYLYLCRWNSVSITNFFSNCRHYHELSNWIVSSGHAILATISGLYIVFHTKNDLIHAKCNLANVYAYVVGGYFLQDSLVLIYVDWQKSFTSEARLRLHNFVLNIQQGIFSITYFFRFLLPNYLFKLASFITQVYWICERPQRQIKKVFRFKNKSDFSRFE